MRLTQFPFIAPFQAYLIPNDAFADGETNEDTFTIRYSFQIDDGKRCLAGIKRHMADGTDIICSSYKFDEATYFIPASRILETL